MAEESNKGIALVILGIVAVIAIVGLVLLFTGAKNATGEFAVPAAKVYGGAIKGVGTPYDRAFAGRANEFASGHVEQFSAQQGVTTDNFIRGEQQDGRKTYEKGLDQVPSYQTACMKLSVLAGYGTKYSIDSSTQQALNYKSMGRDCKRVTDLVSVAYQVNDYGRVRDVFEQTQSIGAGDCCEATTLRTV